MTESRPDTDDRREPGGTPSTGSGGDLTDRPVIPGGDDSAPRAVPGAYQADEAEQERGKAVKPGN